MFKGCSGLLALGVLLLIPAWAHAQDNPRPWEVTLGGTGSNDRDFRTGDFAVSGSLGYFLTKEIEFSGREGLIYHGGTSSGLNTDTKAALDYHFVFGQVLPFVGANVGYHEFVLSKDGGEWGPEAGLKVFVNDTTFIYAIAEYEMGFDGGIHHGIFDYGLGLGFRF